MKTDPAIFDELRSIQHRDGYVSSAAIDGISSKTKLPRYYIHGLASCFPHFRLTPPARVEVQVCDDMSCHRRGACPLRQRLERTFGSRGDGEIAFSGVSCLGRCDGAPAITVNEQIFSGLDYSGAEALIETALAGRALPREPVTETVQSLVSDPYQEGEKYGVLRGLLATRDWDGVIAALKSSDLRGLGGAGFPTGLKWDLVRKAEGQEKYVVCNADESEPGTIKDRFIMETAPHLLVEGMIIAGLVSGAQRGYIYIRHEYERAEQTLAEEIRRCRQQGLIGNGLGGTELSFELENFISPGGYICGEETALLEAMEGKRAEPRNKPPFPVTHGLWSKPTVLNNVETFINVPIILGRGIEWFRSFGRGDCAGVKFIGISGDINKPGIYEVPMGMSFSELIYDIAGGIPGGKKLKAFAPSGPSSGYLPASMIDVGIDFKQLQDLGSMLGSGAVVVCDEATCMLDMALNAVRFFRNESCGKCVPCRVGTQKMVDLLTGWTGKTARRKEQIDEELSLLDELSSAMAMTSICGLGQIAPAPVASVLEHFHKEVTDHLGRQECSAGVCFKDTGSAA